MSVKLWHALGEDEWQSMRTRGIRWSISKDCSTVTVTDRGGRSAKGRTLCEAARAL